jgi:hypothetical protein
MMRRMKALTWAAAVVAVGAATPSVPVAAATPPPDTRQGSWRGIALQAKPSAGLRMGSLHVVLEQTSLFEVRKAVAAGAISSQGDAGAGISWLCYTNLSSPTPERIWISTHNEMGGPERRVMGVTAQLLLEGLATADCPALPPALTPVRIDNGLWLNDKERAVANVLHTVVTEGQEWQQFSYSGKVPGAGGRPPEGCDLLNGFAVKLRAGRVALLQINQVTSC